MSTLTFIGLKIVEFVKRSTIWRIDAPSTLESPDNTMSLYQILFSVRDVSELMARSVRLTEVLTHAPHLGPSGQAEDEEIPYYRSDCALLLKILPVHLRCKRTGEFA